jgi:phosphoenolpyruvate carboxylase
MKGPFHLFLCFAGISFGAPLPFVAHPLAFSGVSVVTTRISPDNVTAPSVGVTTAALTEMTLDMKVHGPLLRDIEMLSDILADVVQRDNPRVHDLYCQLREYGLERAEVLDKNNTAAGLTALEKMIKLSQGLDAKEALGVMRTFSLALNLVNAAEVNHRLRLVLQKSEASTGKTHGPLPFVDDSVRGAFDKLLKEKMASPEEIYRQLMQQKVEIGK